ncbi:hypothetical protein MPNT_70060 [Candidatus Methylacidithermus pantelleriae]|uniref:Uncharacterized protein n=1 Tax=Candidatus Methylacidithermus pantelleriae TaxID=2744239 RepID=A0A8J2BWD7_9BACT|nr:hypothetical protein MPNT_70060 [Candidatus Methylacidithermus pantelleriae]
MEDVAGGAFACSPRIVGGRNGNRAYGAGAAFGRGPQGARVGKRRVQTDRLGKVVRIGRIRFHLHGKKKKEAKGIFPIACKGMAWGLCRIEESRL